MTNKKRVDILRMFLKHPRLHTDNDALLMLYDIPIYREDIEVLDVLLEYVSPDDSALVIAVGNLKEKAITRLLADPRVHVTDRALQVANKNPLRIVDEKTRRRILQTLDEYQK